MNSGFIFTKFIVQDRDHQNFKIINKKLKLNFNFDSRKQTDPFKIGPQEFEGSAIALEFNNIKVRLGMSQIKIK
jgi:hypothetical protein